MYYRRHPNILLKRIFVFNYTFDDPDAHSNVTPLLARIRDPSSLVIFPPDGACGEESNISGSGGSGGGSISGGGTVGNGNNDSTKSHNMVDIHLQEVMSHAALHIVLALEQQMKLCEESRLRNVLPEGLPMSTLFDEMEENAQNSANSSNKSLVSRKTTPNMYKKKPSGRIHKWMGDLCMQVCTPRDAYEHYSNSISECKLLGENLWLAGAYDGFASSVVLLLHMQANIDDICSKEFKNMTTNTTTSTTYTTNTTTSDSENTIEKAYRLVEERMNDAIQIYSTSIVYCALEVECILRVARMFETSAVHANR